MTAESEQISGANTMLVFVNVLGKWVGVLMDASITTWRERGIHGFEQIVRPRDAAILRRLVHQARYRNAADHAPGALQGGCVVIERRGLDMMPERLAQARRIFSHGVEH